MALPTIKTQEEIYESLKTGMQTEAPQITNYSYGSVTRALLYVVAAAIRLVYVVIEALYLNLFPQDADREALKRYYDEWGLTWDNPDEETARKVVLAKYQQKSVIGTAAWYEDTVKGQFGIVTEAYCYPNPRGPGTVDLMVLHNGSPLFESEVADIQGFFDLDTNHVLAADVRVITAGTQQE